MSVLDDLLAARSDVEILRHVARGEWAKSHDGAECPADRIASPGDVADWHPSVDPAAREEADRLLAEALTVADPWFQQVTKAAAHVGAAVRARWTADGEALAVEVAFELDGERWPPVVEYIGGRLTDDGHVAPADGSAIERVHAAWCALPAGDRGRHPIAPLAFDWITHAPTPAQWDTRQHANLPGPLATTRHVVPAADLRGDAAARLPLDWDAYATSAPADAPRFEVGYLPTLEPEPSALVPCALLDLWDTGASRGRHGPVPLARRIGLEVLMAVPPDARADDAVSLSTTLSDLAGGVWPGTKYRPGTHGPQLLAALRTVGDPDHGAVAWRAGEHEALRVLVLVRDWPRSHGDPDARVSFDVRLPPGSKQGPHVDRHALRGLVYSYRQHRLLLTAYCLWDAYATVRGRLIAPTLPVVNLNQAGYVLDTRGRIVTEHGAPTRRVTHRRAVQTGARQTNPEAERRYLLLIGRDLILAGYDRVADTAAGMRKQRHRVIEAAQELGEPVTTAPKRGAPDRRRPARMRVEVVGSGADVGLRMMPTDEHLAAYAARWAANRQHGA